MKRRASPHERRHAGSARPRQETPGSFARRLVERARNNAGNVALIFALALVPIVLAGGAAVDYARAFVVQQRLSAALDATALALGATTETDPDKLSQMAQDYFNANYPAAEIGVPGNLQFTINNTVVSMSATAELDTTLMHVVGITKMDVAAAVEVTKEKNAMEVVLVLDNTGSMGSGGKIEALREASSNLVEIMFGDDQTPDNLKFGLVPFSASVNVGSQYLNSGWIDVNAQSSVHGIQFENGTGNVLDQYDKITNKSWNGCIDARPAPYDTDDTPPDAGNPDTLWVPYFAPDEPDWQAASANGYWYGNSYLGDEVSNGNTDVDFRQRRLPKYENEWVNSDGPHFNCKNQPLQSLTNSKATILAAVNAMNAAGSTVIPIGLAWGWRVISPGEPFTEGASYEDEEVKKVIILLTDGRNDIGALNNHNRSWYNGYGYVGQGRLGTTDPSAAYNELNSRTAQLCENIKSAGMLVFTITFQVGNATIQNLMRDCASDPGKYFNSPSNSELQTTFETIGTELSKLRISK